MTVTLDRDAVKAVGGESALAAQFAGSDLAKAGWLVTGPSPGPNSSVVIGARHGYRTLTEETELLEDLAGSGPPARRPFQISVAHHSTFWHRYTTVTGSVDLRCGLDCFDDPGLNSLLGSPTGVDASRLEEASGQTPGQVFAFSLQAALPGRVSATNGVTEAGGIVRWNPKLGQLLSLTARSEDWNPAAVGLAIGLVGAVVIGLIVTLALVLRRWWRRRHPGAGDGDSGSGPPTAKRRGRRGAHARPRRSLIKAVTPRS